MASVKGFRAGLAKAVEALNYDVSGGAKDKVKSFALKHLRPEISEIAHAASEDAKKAAYKKAGMIGAGAVGLGGTAAFVAGRKTGLHKQAGVMSKVKQLLGRETKGERVQRFIKELPEGVKAHLQKKIKSARWKNYAGGVGIGTAGLLGGYAVGKRD